MKIKGRIVKGLGVGKTLGYPTANLEIYGGPTSEASEVGPQDIKSGVYAARAEFDGVTYNAVAVIGARENNRQPLTEVLVLDFQGNLYGKEMEVELLDKISDIQTFENNAELVKKIKNDVGRVKKYFMIRDM